MLEWLRWGDVTAHRPVESHAHDVLVANPSAVVAEDATDGALGDLHEAEVGIARGGGELDVEGQLVERRPQRIGHHGRRLREHLALAPHALGETRRVRIPAEPHGGLGPR